jgi:hypothetical protein
VSVLREREDNGRKEKELGLLSTEVSPTASSAILASNTTDTASVNHTNASLGIPPVISAKSTAGTASPRPLPSTPSATNSNSNSNSYAIPNARAKTNTNASHSVATSSPFASVISSSPVVPVPYYYALCTECASIVQEELTHVLADLDREIQLVEQSIKDWDRCSDFVIDDDAIAQVRLLRDC